MTEEFKVKYHSTNQFRNVVKTIRDRAQFKGLDEEGNAIIDTTALAPTLEYIGTVKLHGTNANIVLHEDGTITFHSKNNLLGLIDTNQEFILKSDNAEFAQTMSRRMETLKEVIKDIKETFKDKLAYPIKISGEWAGQGIQKGVGIAQLDKKGFFIFGIKLGATWVTVDQLPVLGAYHSEGIYAITDFPVYSLEIDFNNPEYSQNKLVEFTEQVENGCPVSKTLGMVNSEGKPSLLGEGLVWTPNDPELMVDTGTWFKTKGQKHSVSKVKSVAAVCPEKLESIQKFVEYSVTENRLEQGLSEVGLDQKLIGKFIGWVNKDINKEEGDVLEANNLSMKDTGKFCRTKARQWYLEKLNNNF